MSDRLNDDKEVIEKGRESILEESDKVPLRDRIVKKLFTQLKKKEIGQKVVKMWTHANSDRQEWLDRQLEFLSHYDEFVNLPPAGMFEGSSNLHVPLTLWTLKAYHARFLQAIYNPDVQVSVKARKAPFSETAMDLEEFLKYSLQEWSNYYKGVEEAIDQWIWCWLASGIGYTKWRWDYKCRKFIDVVERPVPGPAHVVLGPDGQEVLVPSMKMEEEEVTTVKKVFEGPCLEFIPVEDIVVVGPDMVDIDGADAVIHRQFVTASDLWTLVEEGIFDKEAVEEVIESGSDNQSGAEGSSLKEFRNASAGTATLDKEYDLDRYEILEAYLSMDVDNSGINSEVIVWVHNRSKTLLRATYLDRMNRAGERPFQAISFHKRSGTNTNLPIGLVEMLYPIQKEVNAMHNMRIDFGLLSTCPIGFYRASSSLEPKTLKMSPGTLIPLDNPQTDIVFPQMGNRTAFGMQEEQVLFTFAERLTGISDISLGAISGKQGASRTATGVQALVGESNTNLNVPLKRLNRGWKRSLDYLLHMLQQRTPKGFEFRVTGDDGLTKYKTLVDPTYLYGDFDIEVSPVTEASNKQIQLNNALQIMQLTGNPLDIQLGVITPQNRYEALKNYLKVMGVKDTSKFLSSAMEGQVTLTPKEELARVMAGLDVPVLPNSDHQGVIALVESILGNDELMGTLQPQEAAALQAHAQKHAQMADALAQQAAQAQAANQMRFNSAAANQQTNPGGNPLESAPPAPGMDGME